MKRLIVITLAAVALTATATDWYRARATATGGVEYAPDKTAPGYFPTDTEYPCPVRDGYTVALDYWTNKCGKCVAVYKEVVAPEPEKAARRWTRLKLKTALAQSGWLTTAKTVLGGIEIADDYTAWEALTDCDYIEEGFPTAEKWSQTLDAVAAAIGKSRAEIDAFLDRIPTENTDL